jgi:hypothetical protein
MIAMIGGWKRLATHYHRTSRSAEPVLGRAVGRIARRRFVGRGAVCGRPARRRNREGDWPSDPQLAPPVAKVRASRPIEQASTIALGGTAKVVVAKDVGGRSPASPQL